MENYDQICRVVLSFYFILNKQFDHKHGYGEMYWPNGSVFKGMWSKGERHGNTVLTFNRQRNYDL